ncbi:MAG: transposase [Pirellulaceae bacterium]
MMQPIYLPTNVKPAYQLNWGLTLFPRSHTLSFDLPDLAEATEQDGVRILKSTTTNSSNLQFLVSTRPNVCGSSIVRSVKGRLQYLVRNSHPKAFQRNYCLRSIGSATRETVERYVDDQLGHHAMADPMVQTRLNKYQRRFPVDLSRVCSSAHGRYWYNLHLVLVNQERRNEVRADKFSSLLTMIERCARKYEHRISHVAVLCDHIHLVFGANITESPEGIALKYLTNCEVVCEMRPIFKFSYYVERSASMTLGGFDVGCQTHAPLGQAQWGFRCGGY